jgi:hypothetical protein
LFLSCKKESLDEYLEGKCGTITGEYNFQQLNGGSGYTVDLKIKMDDGRTVERKITTERTDLSWCMNGNKICFFKVNTTRICP